METVQRILKVGNSFAVTIPSNFIKKRKIKVGKSILVYSDLDSGEIKIKTSTKKSRSEITPSFKKWLDDFSKRNTDLIKELAKK